MIAPEHQALWLRIQEFSIDDPSAQVKFSDKLAHHQHWSPEYTARVIEEYRKFLFLSCISPNGASPSQIVDEAWHLHLTYTTNYWKELCRDTLGREIHHHPSKGGAAENKYHFDWYAQTLHLYKEVFDEYPPEDIWPLPVGRTVSNTRIPDTSDLPVRPAYAKYLFLLLLPFGIPFFFDRSNPFHLTGPQFLVFYAVLAVSAIIYLLYIYYFNKEFVAKVRSRYIDNSSNAFQLARYIFGKKRSVQTAIVDLVERNILEANRNQQFTFRPANYHYGSGETNPLIHELMRTFKDGDVIGYKTLVRIYNEDFTHHPLLSEFLRILNRRDYTRIMILALVGIIGIARIIQGIQNDRPVAYLLLIMIFSLLFIAFLVWISDLKNILKKLLTAEYQSGQFKQQFPNQSIATDFAFIGAPVLLTSYMYMDVADTFRRDRGYGDTTYNSSGSGCGSSDGGSSCGGSSCGGSGGGCGGCGGGGGGD